MTDVLTLPLTELTALAEAIKADLTAIDETELEKLRRYRSIGEKLTDAKDKLDSHGRWLEWLAANFSWKGERQAQRYMAFAKTSPGTDLGEERKHWKQCSSHKSSGKKNTEIRSPPPDDGTRSIEFPTAITCETSAQWYHQMMGALKDRHPNLDEGGILIRAVYALFCEEGCEGYEYP